MFIDGKFISHSGLSLPRKIICDGLDTDDLRCLSKWIAEKIGPFGCVYGIPTGGNALERHLWKYRNPDSHRVLIVDDVCTTGASFERKRNIFSQCPDVVGVCLYAIGDYPDWVVPLFQVHPRFRYVPTSSG